MLCFDLLSGRWGGVRALGEPYSQLQLVGVDGLLYTVGGGCLLNVERYDLHASRWSHVAPLQKRLVRSGSRGCSVRQLLFYCLRSDPHRDEWEECPFNKSRSHSSDMVAHHSHV